MSALLAVAALLAVLVGLVAARMRLPYLSGGVYIAAAILAMLALQLLRVQ